VALVNSCNARDRAGLVIENLVGDMWFHPKPRHAADSSTPQIVNNPILDARAVVVVTLEPGELCEGIAIGVEDEIAGSRQSSKNASRSSNKLDNVRSAILRTCRGDGPQTSIGADFIPTHSSNFLPALSC